MGNAAAASQPVQAHGARQGQAAPHDVRLAATEILRVAGVSGYHTSVLLDGREYFFDSVGIMVAEPLWSHTANRNKHPGEVNTEVIDVGRTHLDGAILVQALHQFFQRGSYDIFYKNCNTFTDAALYFLTRTRLHGKYSRIERLVTATNPISTSLLNRVFRSFVENSTGMKCEVDIYVKNPAAEDFRLEDTIETLCHPDSDSDSEASDATEASEAGAPQMSCGVCRQER